MFQKVAFLIFKAKAVKKTGIYERKVYKCKRPLAEHIEEAYIHLWPTK